MATATCVCCGILGRKIMNPHVAPIAGRPPAQRKLVTYYMGHGNTTTDEAVAKNVLLQRDFKEIANLESIIQSEYHYSQGI